MHWTEKELYQIAYVTSRGWEYEERYGENSCWKKDGEERTVGMGFERSVTPWFSLDDAYWAEKANESDTIPSPPNPEIGLMSLLEELCEWYNQTHHLFEAESKCDDTCQYSVIWPDGTTSESLGICELHGPQPVGEADEIPHSLFKRIADHIGYQLED